MMGWFGKRRPRAADEKLRETVNDAVVNAIYAGLEDMMAEAIRKVVAGGCAATQAVADQDVATTREPDEPEAAPQRPGEAVIELLERHGQMLGSGITWMLHQRFTVFQIAGALSRLLRDGRVARVAQPSGDSVYCLVRDGMVWPGADSHRPDTDDQADESVACPVAEAMLVVDWRDDRWDYAWCGSVGEAVEAFVSDRGKATLNEVVEGLHGPWNAAQISGAVGGLVRVGRLRRVWPSDAFGRAYILKAD